MDSSCLYYNAQNDSVAFSGISWDDILALFNDTIALGQIYYDDQGTVVTTFNGLNWYQVSSIKFFTRNIIHVYDRI